MTSGSNSSKPAMAGGVLEGVDLSAMGPGHRLRDARKAVNLDQADIAKKLNLTLTVVNSLERDEYEDMPPPVFVRGYLRAYAVMVNLKPEEVVTMYDALVSGDKPGPDLFRVTTGAAIKTAGSGKSGFPLLIVAVLVVAALVGYWAFSSGLLDLGGDDSSEDPVLLTDEAVVSTDASGAASVAPGSASESPVERAEKAMQEPVVQEPQMTLPAGSVELHEDEATADSTPADDANGSSLKELAETNIESGLEQTPPADAGLQSEDTLAGVNPESNSGANIAADSNAGADAGSAMNGSATPVAIEKPIAVDPDKARLELVFSGKCWTDVRDATGKRVAYGVMNAGVVRDLVGVPPFKVTLGQSDAVVVKYNGALFDHHAFSQGKIARFSVGSSAE